MIIRIEFIIFFGFLIIVRFGDRILLGKFLLVVFGFVKIKWMLCFFMVDIVFEKKNVVIFLLFYFLFVFFGVDIDGVCGLLNYGLDGSEN